MISEGKTPTQESFSTLVGSCACSGLEGKAKSIYSSIEELSKSLPNFSDCNCLLHLLVKRGCLETAQKLYDEMLQTGGPDNFITGILMKGMCMKGRMEEAMKPLKDRLGPNCVPDVVLWAYQENHIRNGDFVMGLKGFVPTMATYGAIINNISILEASAVLKKMIASCCEPDLVTYNILISGYHQHKRVKEAESFLRDAIRRALVPTEFSYTSHIHDISRKEMLI
ncbi:Pentatricopeptide repeat-containing protein [Apostasia shenzhenica]|uniref:Pentatricopeptide repeat-containing protein n=1 Tax=Apostasia shenzhenica TaxID=1088818 RepID=A0A2I0AJ33_9ASPA|nr:Pentatricopeptide repeat-containing protein [Apostasia shenzhenica]